MRPPEAELERLRALPGDGVPDMLMFWSHHARGAAAGPHVLSQWWPAPFVVDGVPYAHAEMFMMAAKARLFGDEATLARVLAAPDPRDSKALGRVVAGFDSRLWEQERYGVVLAGNRAKFGADPGLRAYLLSTAPALLVEASPDDAVWGIGLRADEPAARLPAQWPGRNLLGFALTAVRQELLGG